MFRRKPDPHLEFLKSQLAALDELLSRPPVEVRMRAGDLVIPTRRTAVTNLTDDASRPLQVAA